MPMENGEDAAGQERARGTNDGQGGVGTEAPSSEPSVSIAKALELAAQAGQWEVVAQLGRELEARRLARTGNVVALPVRSSRRW